MRAVVIVKAEADHQTAQHQGQSKPSASEPQQQAQQRQRNGRGQPSPRTRAQSLRKFHVYSSSAPDCCYCDAERLIETTVDYVLCPTHTNFSRSLIDASRNNQRRGLSHRSLLIDASQGSLACTAAASAAAAVLPPPAAVGMEKLKCS